MEVTDGIQPQCKSVVMTGGQAVISTACGAEEEVVAVYSVEFMLLDLKCKAEFHIVEQANRVIRERRF